MWVRTLLFSRVFCYEVINTSHFKASFLLFAPFHTESHWLCANLHRASLGAPFNLLKTWSVHQHHCGMLQAIAALKFAQGATINDKRFCSICDILASTCLPFNSNTSGSSILHSYRIVQLFQQQKAAALIYSAHLAVMVTNWLTPFVFKNLLNKKTWSFKIIFLLPSILCESTDLDVVKKVLVDAE